MRTFTPDDHCAHVIAWLQREMRPMPEQIRILLRVWSRHPESPGAWGQPSELDL
jgi:hypothetical protein